MPTMFSSLSESLIRIWATGCWSNGGFSAKLDQSGATAPMCSHNAHRTKVRVEHISHHIAPQVWHVYLRRHAPLSCLVKSAETSGAGWCSERASMPAGDGLTTSALWSTFRLVWVSSTTREANWQFISSVLWAHALPSCSRGIQWNTLHTGQSGFFFSLNFTREFQQRAICFWAKICCGRTG